MTKQKKQRFYYVQRSPYGIRSGEWSYYAFTSYSARQKWLDAHDMDGVNWVAATITRAELVERIGKRFVIVADYGLYDDDDKQVAYEVLPDYCEDAAFCKAIYSTYRPLF